MQMEPEPEPGPPELDHAAVKAPPTMSPDGFLAAQATGLSKVAGGLERHTPCPQLEALLRNQIETLSDTRANGDLHQWWNWNPEHTERHQDDTSSAGWWMQVAPELAMEVVIADLHDRVIHSCQDWFTRLRLPRPCLMQAPIQEAMLRSLYDEEDVLTFVVFGAYGNGDAESGLQKQLMEAFPEQMRSLQAQALMGGHSDVDGSFASSGRAPQVKCSYEERMRLNMANQGCVWVAEPSPSDPVQLVACAAYPRCQNPSEEVHVGRMFRAALDAIVLTYGGIDTKSAHTPSQPTGGSEGRAGAGAGAIGAAKASTLKTGRQRKIRVVTHALGSFVGHNEPEIFGCGLANGLAEYLAAGHS
jgi:hypothetical protein